MSDPKGPWDLPPEAVRIPAPAPSRRRYGLRPLVWAGLVLGTAGLAVGLSRSFPGSLTSVQDWSHVAFGVGLVALISAGLLRVPRLRLGRTAAQAVIWLAVMAVLAAGFSFRGELGSVARRTLSELAPGVWGRDDPHELVLDRDEADAFAVRGQVNGQDVRFVIDTGASDIVLSPDDARRLGVDLSRLEFARVVETANGAGRSARYTARTLVVGRMALSDVPMSINGTPMSSSLLGMSFLKRLESFQVKDGRLYLRWRG